MSTVVEKSQAEYARHRGLTPKAIEKAIDSGRIPAAAVRYDGRSKLIDVAAADLAWPNKVRVDTAPDAGELAPLSPADPSSSPVPRETPALTIARTESAQIETRIKQLDYERRVGAALSAVDVGRSMERCAELMVRDLDQLPSRADDLVTAYTRDGVAGVRTLLKLISRGMRETLAANMKLLAADDVADDQDAIEPDAAEQTETLSS